MRVFLVEGEWVMGSRVVNKSAENDPFLAAESSDEAQLSVAKTVALGTAHEAFADLVDVAQRCAQRRARCHWHSRKVNDLDADGSEIAIETSSLLGALPVITFEEDIELQLAPHVDLVRHILGNGLVDKADAANDLESLFKRDHGSDALVEPEHLVGDDASDEVIAAAPGVAKEIQAADVKEIERTRCIANPDNVEASSCDAAKRCAQR